MTYIWKSYIKSWYIDHNHILLIIINLLDFKIK